MDRGFEEVSPSPSIEAATVAEPSPDAVVPPPARPPSLPGTLLLGFFAPLLTSLAAVFLVLCFASSLPGAPRTRALVGWALRSTDYSLLVPLSAGVFALGALASFAVRKIGVSDLRAIESLIETLRTAPGISWLLLVLAMGFGPGFGEEIWVRGHVLRALGQRFRPHHAILVSAFLFALLHLDPAHILFALPFGLVFGWLAIRTDSILPGMLCHALVNSTVNLVRAIEVRRPGYDLALHPLAVERRDVLWMLGLAAAGVAAGVVLERRLRAAPATGLAGGAERRCRPSERNLDSRSSFRGSATRHHRASHTGIRPRTPPRPREPRAR